MSFVLSAKSKEHRKQPADNNDAPPLTHGRPSVVRSSAQLAAEGPACSASVEAAPVPETDLVSVRKRVESFSQKSSTTSERPRQSRIFEKLTAELEAESQKDNMSMREVMKRKNERSSASSHESTDGVAVSGLSDSPTPSSGSTSSHDPGSSPEPRQEHNGLSSELSKDEAHDKTFQTHTGQSHEEDAKLQVVTEPAVEKSFVEPVRTELPAHQLEPAAACAGAGGASVGGENSVSRAVLVVWALEQLRNLGRDLGQFAHDQLSNLSDMETVAGNVVDVIRQLGQNTTLIEHKLRTAPA